MKYAKFSQNVYFCSICLTDHKGARCIQLLCSHIFCHSCLKDFWKSCIAEGCVERVGCPDPECVKSRREAVEAEVARVTTPEELSRWKWLKEKRALEKGLIHMLFLRISLSLHRPNHRTLSSIILSNCYPKACGKGQI